MFSVIPCFIHDTRPLKHPETCCNALGGKYMKKLRADELTNPLISNLKVKDFGANGLSEEILHFGEICYLRAYSKRILSPLPSSAKITGGAPLDPPLSWDETV